MQVEIYAHWNIYDKTKVYVLGRARTKNFMTWKPLLYQLDHLASACLVVSII
jgi:hypothetical protein